MEHLVGRDVQVVLSLKEGKGFDPIPNPTSIVATLNGQSLETGPIESDSKPRYDTDLVWKADKNLLRKLRCSQEPLKIECFEVKKNDKKEKIGHVLLSLRSAKIVPSGERGESIDVVPNWHKLLNLRCDIKAHKPEVSFALTIEEHDAYVLRKSREESTENNDGVTNNFSTITTPYFVKEESLVQLGPEASCRNLFLLNIIAINAQNLHLLKDKSYDETANGNYSLWYRILENDIRLKSFNSLEHKWTLNEKIVIRIRSSYDVLISYLQERPNFLLILQYKDTILGHSEVDLRPLIPTETSYDFVLTKRENNGIIIHQRCILNKERAPRTIGDCQDNEAFLNLQLQLVSADVLKINHQPSTARVDIHQAVTSSRHDAFSEIDAHRNSCGDFSKCIDQNQRIFPTDLPNGGNVGVLREMVSLPRGMITTMNSCNGPIVAKCAETHRCYCLNISLTAIKLFSSSSSPPPPPPPSSPSIRSIEFRFHHPKTEIISILCSKLPLSTNEKFKLHDIRYKLHLVSAADEIQRLLMAFPPKISISDVTDNEAITTRIGETILDPGLLFNCDKMLESQYEASLYDKTQKEIGRINVDMYLEDRGNCYQGICNCMSGENFGPPIIDDSLAYKVVEELETWKERQQEIFRIELKRKEERHLDRLSEEWQKRRENLESKLACSVQQCKMLANSLNKATEDLRNRRLKSLEKEARLIKANEDLQWRLENNIKELQECWRRTQQELTSKVNLLQQEKNNVEAGFETLRLENEKLWLLTSKQAEEIKVCRKGSLTKDQTASLLQDVKTLEQKLANTQKSKSFFKEQWGKAVREIHRMKMENQQAIEVQIKTSKDELKSFDLEQILGADSDALTNDQIMLDHIQKEIEVIEPKSVAHIQQQQTDGMQSRSIFASIDTPLYSQREALKSQRGGCTGASAKSEEQDERLRKLIEERDALLKTGSYTIDDTIIVKLNAEIRSLLISN